MSVDPNNFVLIFFVRWNLWHYFQVDNEFCILDGRDITENAIFERFNSVLNIFGIVNIISKGFYISQNQLSISFLQKMEKTESVLSIF